jgi:probable phosphoglycerate mutase
MRILLARHGETPWNAEGRYQGQEDIPLSEVGIAQATALGERLHELRIDRALASPLSRARRTAELALGEARASQLLFDDGFKEIGHGEWEGLLASEIRERDGERLQAWRDAPDTVQMPGPGGESLQQVLDRAWPAFARACSGLGEADTLLVVAHDAVNRVLLCRVLGIPLSKLWTFRQAPTTLNLLEGGGVDALDVVRLNDCSHHTALFGEAVHRAL